jgi:dihydrofolate reductase
VPQRRGSPPSSWYIRSPAGCHRGCVFEASQTVDAIGRAPTALAEEPVGALLEEWARCYRSSDWFTEATSPDRCRRVANRGSRGNRSFSGSAMRVPAQAVLIVDTHVATRGEAVKIVTRMCTSLDGCVATADGLPVQLAFPAWDAGALGFYELQERCDAVLVGRTTFEPALRAPYWPWGDLAVYVLGSQRPAGSPDHVMVDSDPARLVERLRSDNGGGDVHLVGGPKTVDAVLALGALTELRLLVLPMLVGHGLRLTPTLRSTISLTFSDARSWPHGVIELTYQVEG